MAAPLPAWKGMIMKLLLVFICAIALLATTGCIIPVEEGGGGRGYSEHGDHGYHGGYHGDYREGDNH